MTESVPITVAQEDEGKRLDRFLAERLPGYSRVQLRRAVHAGGVTVDGQGRKASYRLRVGQRVAVQLPEPPREGPLPEPIPLRVLYEDDHLAAIDKPPGMVVHPARGHWRGTLAGALAHHFQQLSQAGGPARPGIVHRLDRDTSGVILVAKSDPIHHALARQFERRQVRKTYVAICRGSMDRDRDEIDQPIGVHPYQREKMAIRADHPTVRPASTYFEVERRWDGFVLLRVAPKTGRTHQIRVHLAHVGCPIVCDPLYAGHARITLGELERGPVDAGAYQQIVLDRLALHALSLELTHPATGQELRLEAPLPADLRHLIETLDRLRSPTAPRHPRQVR